MTIELRRAGGRFVTGGDGRETRHSFSFGRHYDPENLGFGALVCHNDDLVEPGAGYPDHPHQEIEIVTWVLSGALAHRDSSGRSGVITPGQVQVMSAGSGIVHSETVEPGSGATRFVQTWVRPATWGEPPAYAAAEVGADLAAAAGWLTLASGRRAHGALPLRNPGATLWVASVVAGQRLVVPEAAAAHLFVATGGAVLSACTNSGSPGHTIGTSTESAEQHLGADADADADTGAGQRIGEGDAVRLIDQGADLVVTEPGQLMLWAFA